MGAARLGGAGDQTVGEWEGPSVPGRARGQGKHRGFRPPTRDALLAGARLHPSFRGRGSRPPAGVRQLGHNLEVTGPGA